MFSEGGICERVTIVIRFTFKETLRKVIWLAFYCKKLQMSVTSYFKYTVYNSSEYTLVQYHLNVMIQIWIISH